MPNWTPKQKEVIDARDQNILVSAAAGSGKTADTNMYLRQPVREKPQFW